VKKTSFIEIHKIYWSAISRVRGQAVLNVFIGSMAGLFELMTLSIITPILGLDMGLTNHGFANKYLTLFAPEQIFGHPATQFALLILTAAMSVGVRWYAFRRFVDLRFDVSMWLRAQLLERLLVMRWERYHQISGGSVTSSIMHAVWQIGEGVEQYLQSLTSFFIVLVLLSFAFAIAPQMALIVALYSVTVAGISYLLSRRSQTLSTKIIGATEKMAALSHQIFENLKYIRVSGVKDWARSFLGMSFESDRSGHTKIARLNEIHFFGLELTGIILIGILVMTYRITNNLAFGTFVMFMGLFYRSLPRLQGLQSTYFAAAARVPWLIWWKNLVTQIGDSVENENQSSILPPNFEPNIEFKNVSFTYSSPIEAGTGVNVINNLSFSLKKGRILALVGESGSGKSTVMDLLLGLITPQSGEIFVGGFSLSTVDLELWRRCIGFLPQEPLLFSGSIVDNVAFAAEHVDTERVIRCLKAAQAWEFVSAMPEGIDTFAGERAGRLSGGEKQRLALARALYREPKILILDEPTSALDEANIDRFLKVLVELKQQLTILIITHQTNVLSIADEVIALSKQGTGPAELDLENSGNLGALSNSTSPKNVQEQVCP